MKIFDISREAGRMLAQETRSFAKDERGSVLALTVAFALPLALFLFVSFNSGVALLSRMRAQNVADAAAYSASLWHARFLNYCAYTRRHIVGNFTTIALCTCYVNSNKMYDNVYEAAGLTPTANEDDLDNGTTITDQISLQHAALQLAIPVVEYIREGSDIMNGWLTKSQQAMYLAVAVDAGPAIMKKVAEDASGKQDTDFELDLMLSHGSLVGAGVLDGRKEIPQDEVKAYFSTYTNRAWWPGSILYFHRGRIPFLSSWAGFAIPPTEAWQPEFNFTLTFAGYSDELEVTDSRMSTADHVIPFASMYCWFYMWVELEVYNGPVLFATPIFGDSTKDEPESYYDLKNKFSSVLVYEAKKTGTPKEPGSFAVVNVVENTAPFFRPLNTRPQDLYADPPIRAFSRAKAYFRGYSENMSSGRYTRANLNYPFWGAKLSPIKDGGTLMDATVSGILGMRMNTQYPEY